MGSFTFIAKYTLINMLPSSRPLIGGTFSRPAEQFPRVFDTAFWRAHAYLLPGLLAAGVCTIGLVAAFFFLPEARRLCATYCNF